MCPSASRRTPGYTEMASVLLRPPLLLPMWGQTPPSISYQTLGIQNKPQGFSFCLFQPQGGFRKGWGGLCLAYKTFQIQQIKHL